MNMSSISPIITYSVLRQIVELISDVEGRLIPSGVDSR